jgi:hypothetical protein
MKKILPFFIFLISLGATNAFATGILYAQISKFTPSPTLLASPTPSSEPAPVPTPRMDITQKTEESVGPLEKLLNDQTLGPVWPKNPLKYAIRHAINAGVPANTIVLLLLLPIVAALIAAARHLIGLRGFGIFLPAALSVVFVAMGPVLGILLFLVIIFFSTFFRMATRKLKLKLQYLPRMAMLLWFVVIGVLGILFLAPVVKQPDISNISIFPVLILVLLAEDFSRVQIGKSAKTAVSLTTETLILALISFLFLTLKPLQAYALLNPEIFLLLVLVFDFVVGKYVGLRFIEYWRFRKLISSS